MFRFPKPFSHHEHPREIIRQFTPNWFTATMGTGATALVLNQFPVPLPGLHAAASMLWQANIVLFATLSLLYVARWLLYPQASAKTLAHAATPMALGAIPMGLATIVNGYLAFGIARYGAAAVTVAQALWYVDAILAVGIGLLVPFMMFTRQTHNMESMTGLWLLPFVACEVAAASGGLLAPHVADSLAAAHMLFASYLLWALSVPLALSILACCSCAWHCISCRNATPRSPPGWRSARSAPARSASWSSATTRPPSWRRSVWAKSVQSRTVSA